MVWDSCGYRPVALQICHPVVISNQSHDPAKALAEAAAVYRRLDEEATQRQHFRHEDEEGGLWLWEAVPYQGELVAIKQVEIDPSGTVSRY